MARKTNARSSTRAVDDDLAAVAEALEEIAKRKTKLHLSFCLFEGETEQVNDLDALAPCPPGTSRLALRWLPTKTGEACIVVSSSQPRSSFFDAEPVTLVAALRSRPLAGNDELTDLNKMAPRAVRAIREANALPAEFTPLAPYKLAWPEPRELAFPGSINGIEIVERFGGVELWIEQFAVMVFAKSTPTSNTRVEFSAPGSKGCEHKFAATLWTLDQDFASAAASVARRMATEPPAFEKAVDRRNEWLRQAAFNLDKPWKQILSEANAKTKDEGWGKLANVQSAIDSVKDHCKRFNLPKPPQRKAGRKPK